jgi:hypothetical protein
MVRVKIRVRKPLDQGEIIQSKTHDQGENQSK